MRLILCSIAVGACAVAAGADVASACSPPPGGLSGRSVQPPDDATGVPTNAEIRLRYDGQLDLDPQIRIRPEGELPVEIEVERIGGYSLLGETFFIVRPVAGLEANTTYEVLDRVTVPCDRDCMAPGFQVVASFTTGDTADLTPPEFAGLANIDSDYYEFGGTCGEYTTVIFHLSWERATDEQPVEWLRYNVYTDEGRQVALYAGTTISGQARCSGRSDFWPIDARFGGPLGAYWVRAVDLAGNEDTNARKLSTIGCGAPQPEPDAGPGSPDAGPVDHDARADSLDAGPSIYDDPSGGCAAASSTEAGLDFWLAFAVVAGFAWNRRRRLARRSS